MAPILSGTTRSLPGKNRICQYYCLAVPKTKAERLTTGDPRLSIEERYPSHAKYVKEVTKAAKKLEKRGFLRDEDVRRHIEAAEASSIGN